MLHQTVIGIEALQQLRAAGERQADVVFGCAGGGSNLAGLTFPMIGQNLREGTTTRFVACEPAACPSLTQGEFRYDFGDVAGLTPMLKMYTLGADFVRWSADRAAVSPRRCSSAPGTTRGRSRRATSTGRSRASSSSRSSSRTRRQGGAPSSSPSSC